jgi:hypothetical protein
VVLDGVCSIRRPPLLTSRKSGTPYCMVRNVQKMPQESAEEIASARSVVDFSELLESTSESQSARKKYNFFQKSA